MLKSKKPLSSFLLSLSFLLLSLPVFLSAEEITITTYYPSPYGSYRQLTADQVAIGSAYRNPAYADGTLYVSGNVGIGTTGPNAKLEVKAIDSSIAVGGTLGNPPIAQTGIQFLNYGTKHVGFRYDGLGNLIYESASNAANPTLWHDGGFANFIVRNGNVGIGTTPGAKLDVAGNVKIADGTQGANKVLTDVTGSGLASWQPPVPPSGTISVRNPTLLSNGWSNEPNLRDNNVATYASWSGSSNTNISAGISYDTGSIQPILFTLEGKADATLPYCGIYPGGAAIGGAGLSVQYSYNNSNWHDYVSTISSGGNGQTTSSGHKEIGGIIFARYIRFLGSVGQGDASCPAASGTLYIYEARILY